MALPLILLLAQPVGFSESRTVPYASGARLVSVRLPSATKVSVELWFDSRDLMDRPGANGWRHLLEHLTAAQAAGMEERLERRGYLLKATTYATAMRFSLEVPRSDVDMALGVMRMIVQPLKLTPERVAQEKKILEHEWATAGSSEDALAAAVMTLTKGQRMVPAGNLDGIKAIDAPLMTEFQRHQFSAKRTLLLLMGDVDHAFSELVAGPFFSNWKYGNPATPFAFPTGAVETQSSAFGGRAVALSLPTESSTSLWVHQYTGGSLAEHIPGAFYRQSTGKDEVVMSLWAPGSSLKDALARVSVADYFGSWPGTLARWQKPTQEMLAFNEGLRQSGGAGVPLDQMVKSASQATAADFEQALAAWKSAPTIGGAR